MIKTDNNGSIRYFNKQGQLHREDGPAIEYSELDKDWYFNGMLHRTDGPAQEFKNGYKVYNIMGKRYSYEEWLAIKDFTLLW